jgi:hypothetical protein
MMDAAVKNGAQVDPYADVRRKRRCTSERMNITHIIRAAKNHAIPIPKYSEVMKVSYHAMGYVSSAVTEQVMLLTIPSPAQTPVQKSGNARNGAPIVALSIAQASVLL